MPIHITITCDSCGANKADEWHQCIKGECKKVVCGGCARKAGMQQGQGFWGSVWGLMVGKCPFCKSDTKLVQL
jgi:hypothetical protein